MFYTRITLLGIEICPKQNNETVKHLYLTLFHKKHSDKSGNICIHDIVMNIYQQDGAVATLLLLMISQIQHENSNTDKLHRNKSNNHRAFEF